MARIIKVADFEAWVIGLEDALRNVARMGLEDENRVSEKLLFAIRELGNYVARSGQL